MEKSRCVGKSRPICVSLSCYLTIFQPCRSLVLSHHHLCQKHVICVFLKPLDNKEFFHIFNKRQSKCLSALRTNLSAEDCDLQSCVQKWMRSADGKLVHVNSLGADLMCISRNQPVESSVLTLQNCSQNPLRWKCENDLLKLRGYNLYLNYEKLHKHLNLLSSAGTASHWVRYSTRDNICSAGKKGKNGSNKRNLLSKIVLTYSEI